VVVAGAEDDELEPVEVPQRLRNLHGLVGIGEQGIEDGASHIGWA